MSQYSNVVIFIQISLVHRLRINDFFLVVSSHLTVCAFYNQRSKHISSWSYTANFVSFSIQFLGGLFELFVQKVLKKIENIRFNSIIKINKKRNCNCNWKNISESSNKVSMCLFCVCSVPVNTQHKFLFIFVFFSCFFSLQSLFVEINWIRLCTTNYNMLFFAYFCFVPFIRWNSFFFVLVSLHFFFFFLLHSTNRCVYKYEWENRANVNDHFQINIEFMGLWINGLV